MSVAYASPSANVLRTLHHHRQHVMTTYALRTVDVDVIPSIHEQMMIIMLLHHGLYVQTISFYRDDNMNE